MNIFEFAMEKEKFSETYYRQLAGQTSDTGLKNICNMLADEEGEHYKIVEQMSRNISAEVAEAPVLHHAKEIFEKMRDSAEKFNFNISELELYQKARDIEEESFISINPRRWTTPLRREFSKSWLTRSKNILFYWIKSVILFPDLNGFLKTPRCTVLTIMQTASCENGYYL